MGGFAFLDFCPPPPIDTFVLLAISTMTKRNENDNDDDERRGLSI